MRQVWKSYDENYSRYSLAALKLSAETYKDTTTRIKIVQNFLNIKLIQKSFKKGMAGVDFRWPHLMATTWGSALTGLPIATSTLNYSYLYKKIVQNRSRKPEELMVYRVILSNDRVATTIKLFGLY